MYDIIEKYTVVLKEKGLTTTSAEKAAIMVYQRLFIEPASPGKLWYNHDAAEAFIPSLKLMGWTWFKALIKGRLPAFETLPTIADMEQVGNEVVPCPRCSKPTVKVEIVYPGEWGEPETKTQAWLCAHCRYVFADSDIDYIR